MNYDIYIYIISIAHGPFASKVNRFFTGWLFVNKTRDASFLDQQHGGLLIHIARVPGVLERSGLDKVYLPVLGGGAAGSVGLGAGGVGGGVQGKVQIPQLCVRIEVWRGRHGRHTDHAQVVMCLQHMKEDRSIMIDGVCVMDEEAFCRYGLKNKKIGKKTKKTFRGC